MKLINGEWLSEEECFRKHGKLVFVGLKKLLPAAKKIGVDREDLISEGRIGFIKAYRLFDDSLGFKFSTYATRMVYGYASRFIRDKAKSVKYSRSIYELAAKIRKEDVMDWPKKDIAKRFGVPLKLVDDAFISMLEVHSLNKLSFEDNGNDITTLEDLIGSEDDYTEVNVRHFITGLNPKERKIIELRLMGKGQVEIGKEVGISQTHVGRVLKKIGKQYLAM